MQAQPHMKSIMNRAQFYKLFLSSLEAKDIFLLDGSGAVISAILTGIIMPIFYAHIGLPIWLMHSLAIIPILYAIFSISCYLLVKEYKPWMFKAIITANLLYCIITFALIVGYRGLSVLGKTVLFLEILTVIGVVLLEFRVYKKTFSTTKT